MTVTLGPRSDPALCCDSEARLLRPAFPRGAGFLWWEWLVETMFPVPGNLLLGWSSSLGLQRETDSVERLKVAWAALALPIPIAQGPGLHWETGPFCGCASPCAEGQGLSLPSRCAANSGAGAAGFDWPSVLSGLSVVSEVGFSRRVALRLCAEAMVSLLSV